MLCLVFYSLCTADASVCLPSCPLSQHFLALCVHIRMHAALCFQRVKFPQVWKRWCVWLCSRWDGLARIVCRSIKLSRAGRRQSCFWSVVLAGCVDSLHIWPLKPLPTPIRISRDSVKGDYWPAKKHQGWLSHPPLSFLAAAASVVTQVRTTVSLH